MFHNLQPYPPPSSQENIRVDGKPFQGTIMFLSREEYLMPNCPECAGVMKRDPNIRLFVCQRCGIALSREEIDHAKEKFRGELYDRSEEEHEQRRKEYLDWWLKAKD